MQCLVSEDKFELLQVERGLSVEKCISAPLLVNQKQNEKELIKSIFLIVKRFNDLVNVGKKMNEDQMIDLSADLFDRFGSESLEDVMLFFKMARSGEFGDLYRLDTIVILSWIPKYMDKRITAFHDDRVNQENIKKRQENECIASHVPDDKAKEKLEQLSNMLQTATISRNTGVIRKDNPLFDYKAYLTTLPEAVKKMSDEHLQTMIGNTSKYSHPEVYEILQQELEFRKANPKNKKKK